MSIWASLAVSAMSWPWRVVQWLTDAPATSTTSAWGMTLAANGEAKPPEMPSA